MRIIKYYKKGIVKGRWRFFELSDTEVMEIEEQLRKDNIKVMINCCVDAKEECKGMEVGNAVRIAVHLFDKLADAKFTRIQSKLDEKIKVAEESGIVVKQFEPKITLHENTETNKLREDKIKSDSGPTLDSETKQVVKD